MLIVFVSECYVIVLVVFLGVLCLLLDFLGNNLRNPDPCQNVCVSYSLKFECSLSLSESRLSVSSRFVK